MRRYGTWDKVGGHVGQTDEYNRAGVQGSRPKRKGVWSVQNGSANDSAGGRRTACMGEEEKEKY
jgi:hypothetical protein